MPEIPERLKDVRTWRRPRGRPSSVPHLHTHISMRGEITRRFFHRPGRRRRRRRMRRGRRRLVFVFFFSFSVRRSFFCVFRFHRRHLHGDGRWRPAITIALPIKDESSSFFVFFFGFICMGSGYSLAGRSFCWWPSMNRRRQVSSPSSASLFLLHHARHYSILFNLT